MKNERSTRLPPLKSLQVFEAAARHASVARAAQELHVTQGAVSRQVSQLEDALGVALFERRNRGVYLTAAGAQLQQVCEQALRMLAQGVDAAREHGAQAPLVLSCEPTLAMHWLIPRLPALQKACPQLQVQLVAAGGVVDWECGRVDLAIRRDDIAVPSDCVMTALAPEYTGPVANADVLAQWQGARTQASAPTGLHTHSRPQAWPQWLSRQKLGAAAQPLHTAMWLEHFYLCLQAAQSGLGVGMASVYMADAAVHSGSLHAPYGWQADGSQYVLLQPPGRSIAAAAQVADWLGQALQHTLRSHRII